MTNKKALILVDLQNDFCAGGNLAVPDGDAVIPLANHLQEKFDLILATQDWHPQNHTSFASNHPGNAVWDLIELNGLSQVLWPDHCIQCSKGAEFHPQLNTHKMTKIVHKGIDPNIDSYSAFYDNAHKRSTGLGEYLKSIDVQDVYIMGLATDYCVKFSCLDAVKLGFNVYLLEDACRGVELKLGDSKHAVEEMRQEGVHILQTKDVLT